MRVDLVHVKSTPEGDQGCIRPHSPACLWSPCPPGPEEPGFCIIPHLPGHASPTTSPATSSGPDWEALWGICLKPLDNRIQLPVIRDWIWWSRRPLPGLFSLVKQWIKMFSNKKKRWKGGISSLVDFFIAYKTYFLFHQNMLSMVRWMLCTDT